jgi:DNA-binding beta-propeller fold protein YncE
VPLPGLGYGSAITPDGNWLIIANPLIHKVSAINLHTLKVEHILDFPVRPQAILVNPNGRVAYVSCDRSRKVGVIDLVDWKVTKLIDAGPGCGWHGLGKVKN